MLSGEHKESGLCYCDQTKSNFMERFSSGQRGSLVVVFCGWEVGEILLSSLLEMV